MSKTPRTDTLKLSDKGVAGLMVDYDTLCRQLETELAESQQELSIAREELKQYKFDNGIFGAGA